MKGVRVSVRESCTRMCVGKKEDERRFSLLCEEREEGVRVREVWRKRERVGRNAKKKQITKIKKKKKKKKKKKAPMSGGGGM